MEILCAAVCSFLLDLLLGDPDWMPHPVVGMGRCISALERVLRRIFPRTPRGELAAGTVLAAALSLGALTLSALALHLCGLIHPALQFGLSALWCWQCLAVKGLKDESTNVYRKLAGSTLEEARKAVSRIVGRDTEGLTAEGVVKAAVETVAENFSDGVAAPLCYTLLGGAPLALCYKAVNTMDSMVGYKNERYLYFGRAAARLDDAVNYIPARLSALLLILAAALGGQDWKNAWKTWRRDQRNHPSPNSAQTESAMAGALGVRLAGPASYFGKVYQKPTIGDPLREIEPEDILRANRLMVTGSVLCLLLLAGIRGVIVWS